MVEAEFEKSPAGVGVNLYRRTAAARGDARHEVRVGARAVDIAGHCVEQPQLDVRDMHELVSVFGETECFLGEGSRHGPVADAELEVAEGAERVRQVADETPVARRRDRTLELAT